MSSAPTTDVTFEAERSRLVGGAYRITGSRADADDIVQDAWLRWQAADRAGIDRPAAWLTTVVSRIALDRLKSAQHRRETYVGPWLPEAANVESGVEQHAEMVESLTLGFLAVLERLNPVERVVFLLADVFGVPFDEIAGVVDKSPAACRQVASRARRRVHDERPRFEPTDDEAWAVTLAFLDAATRGDMASLMELLAPEVVAVSDGGPDHHAARRPVVGVEKVARFVSNLTRRGLELGVEVEARLVNGQPGVVVFDDGVLFDALVCSVVDGRVDRIWTLVNPEKTATIDTPPVV